MAEAARRIDLIDVNPRFVMAEAVALNNRFRGVDTADMLRAVLTERLVGKAAVVSSFGAESAVLLHLVASIDPTVPVLLLDTLKLFPETLAYRDTLVARLGLTDVRSLRPDPTALAAKDATDLRWSYDPDGCCEIRKVEPLARGLEGFDASITGRKGFQSATRTGLPRFEVEDGRMKVNPLASWTKTDLDGYFAAHDLPRHPLEAEGYLSIGCAPCTSVVKPGEDPRAGRWRGWDKVECGIHSDVPTENDPIF
ncbi:phosphoadenylyl-sulfate reductase [Sphingomonas profundi]|uniref:phosphoadenylyl-sulfate reductase n=1 Tax=Alterirhizorhabdus profundi TaxID=2681549 RepID=UPI0012E992AF|nr:phosphoadenylyl-sulfate reductase [Sphingomonas profundi]